MINWIQSLIVLGIILLPNLDCFGQGLFTDSIVQPYRIVEEMPKYPGGERRMYRFISKNIIYPEQAKQDSVEGTVYVQFVVAETGDVTNVEVLRGPRADLNDAAVAVVKQMPRWKPGRQRGKPVPVFYNLPIRFSLE